MIKALLMIASGVPMSRARLLPVVVVTLLPAVAWPQGNPVGPEFRVNTSTTNNQWFHAVSADPAGNFVVVWQSSAAPSGVFGQRYDSSGAPLGPEFRVNTFTTGQGGPAVASDASGNFVVVWTSTVQDDQDVLGRRFASTGAPIGPEFRVNTYTTDSQIFPAVAVADDGAFVVTWMSWFQDGSYAGVYAQRFAGTGAPLGPEFRVNNITFLDQIPRGIGTDPAGNFVVVWESGVGDGDSYSVFGQRFAASGAPLGAQFRINTFTTNTQSTPDVDVDGSGNFVVVWQSRPPDGSSFGIFGQRFAASGAPLGGEFRVNTHTYSHQIRPAVALDRSGNFVVAWQSLSGSEYDVFAQRYDATGTPLGAEFPVNTTVPFDQAYAAVTADDAGKFVIVWRSWQAGPSAWNVFGQRYNQILPVELMHLSIE